MAYVSIDIEGGFLPADLIDRIASGQQVEGQQPKDFGLGPNSRISDEVQGAFSDVRAFWDAFARRRAHSRESLTSLTREAWMVPLLERLGFSPQYQRAAALIDGDSYLVSHRAGSGANAPPIHIVAIDQRLDQRAEGGRRSPHALVQEYLNRSDALWGLLTNGQTIRLLRQSARISRPSYLEFDLQAIVEGNQYSEFVLLYRLLHQTRFPAESAGAHDCWLERYYLQGIAEGGRVREHLRDGVEAALDELGDAFLAHPDSNDLRQAIRSRTLPDHDYYRELLRLIYRLLFLMVIEERRLIFHEPHPRQSIYSSYYSVARLRERCDRPFAEDHHSDLWQGLLQTFALFRDDESARQLGLSALDGELFGPFACRNLEAAGCENARLLRAVFCLSTFADGRVRRRVNYAGLDVEELGSVYESLLDYRPHVEIEAEPRFQLIKSGERKETGSYYTPPELVHELIESALVPVIEERLAAAATREAKEAALLALRVCDPASGSGHFLLAAARRIARELAKVRIGEQEPPPDAYRAAVREVIRQCIYAVDKNPLAVDLCKVALWLEGHNAGLPLSFLDAHVKCGDSLVGVFDLAVLDQGVPDGAYAAVAGDDKAAAAYLLKRNRAERLTGQTSLDFGPAITSVSSDLAAQFAMLGLLEERTADQVREKQARYEALRGRADWWTEREACDLWTAAFFLPKRSQDARGQFPVPTTLTVRDHLTGRSPAHGLLVGQTVALSEQLPFFHWPLEFPDVVERGGFDVVLGNPPFLGGLKISEAFGDHYRGFVSALFPPAGIADLCAFFVRRAFTLLRTGGNLGLVATNSIGQGDTREAGLATLAKDSGAITFARRFIKWPGVANVEVNLVAVHKGSWAGPLLLDGVPVAAVSSRLDDEPEAEPKSLAQNAGVAFIGSYVRGIGFVLETSEALELLILDLHNGDCLFPYLNGEDANSRADQSPSRWVINFFDWPLERAAQYPDLLRIVEERVKPERGTARQSAEAEKWWLFARLRGEMHHAIAPLRRVLVRSEVSGMHAMTFVPNGYVYSHMLIVFAFDDDYHFALLQSNPHEAWVWKHASSLESRNRYTPSDCFDNFPFPQQPDAADRAVAEQVGAAYHEHRRQVILARNLGLN